MSSCNKMLLVACLEYLSFCGFMNGFLTCGVSFVKNNNAIIVLRSQFLNVSCYSLYFMSKFLVGHKYNCNLFRVKHMDHQL
jgi:hypothetical protein